MRYELADYEWTAMWRGTGVQHKDIGADIPDDTMRGGFVGDVSRDRGYAQAGCDGVQRLGAAGNHSHLCAVLDEGLDQTQRGRGFHR